ncbi:PREDICTED: leucine-rich repeat-containing protein 56-like isoform X2 [Amphimedon queenslandica]|uniref:U2A'/phosphoprotein 32 family A C-terminal domain-containing protein n=1 Tax=Amphimedon queenslandica TaxID=400682 RepID=A0A1X7VPG0_AMPQE|nr:PREDICTED: leucine-rich repeat-containing protein 56-like isoform X2 [Amphimedon queenslandica]|eukprot:XP_003383254.1 PREDICTED: leucine-rich repeat-containing protein 56-like isoform X2 [Amphimedon queenslandica]
MAADEEEQDLFNFPPRPHTALGSLHSSSIRITESELLFGHNPVPLASRSQPVSSPDNQFLSQQKLRDIAGVHDLSKVMYLELSVNTSTTSLGNFGYYLTQLNQLRLYSSRVPSIRDLGTSLSQLKVLWMASCHLKDLDGLAALPSLQELYVANNNIKDISLISLLTDLEILDIERNFLNEEDQLGYLCLCPQLSNLTLSGNPVSHTLSATPTGYRAAVRKYIPHLKCLDEVPYEDIDLESSASSALLSPSLVEGWRKMSKGKGISPLKLQSRVHGGASVKEDSSDLTHGVNQVICGNPVRALKARQQSIIQQQHLHTPEVDSPLHVTSSMERPTTIEHPVSPPPAPPPTSRPHTASDFRSRRYVRNSTVGSLPRSRTMAPHSLTQGMEGKREGIATSITPVHAPRVLLTLKKT